MRTVVSYFCPPPLPSSLLFECVRKGAAPHVEASFCTFVSRLGLPPPGCGEKDAYETREKVEGGGREGGDVYARKTEKTTKREKGASCSLFPVSFGVCAP